MQQSHLGQLQVTPEIRQFLLELGRGLSVPSGRYPLEVLKDASFRVEDPAARRAIIDLHDSQRAGESGYEALKRHPDVFPEQVARLAEGDGTSLGTFGEKLLVVEIATRLSEILESYGRFDEREGLVLKVEGSNMFATRTADDALHFEQEDGTTLTILADRTARGGTSGQGLLQALRAIDQLEILAESERG
jgi:hypothetical protein